MPRLYNGHLMIDIMTNGWKLRHVKPFLSGNGKILQVSNKTWIENCHSQTMFVPRDFRVYKTNSHRFRSVFVSSEALTLSKNSAKLISWQVELDRELCKQSAPVA